MHAFRRLVHRTGGTKENISVATSHTALFRGRRNTLKLCGLKHGARRLGTALLVALHTSWRRVVAKVRKSPDNSAQTEKVATSTKCQVMPHGTRKECQTAVFEPPSNYSEQRS